MGPHGACLHVAVNKPKVLLKDGLPSTSLKPSGGEVSEIILQGPRSTGEFVKNEASWASSPQTLIQNAGAWEYAF